MVIVIGLVIAVFTVSDKRFVRSAKLALVAQRVDCPFIFIVAGLHILYVSEPVVRVPDFFCRSFEGEEESPTGFEAPEPFDITARRQFDASPQLVVIHGYGVDMNHRLAFGIEPGRHPVAGLLDAEVVEYRLLFVAGTQAIDHPIVLASQAIECLPLFEGAALAHIAFLVRHPADYRIALETIAFVISPLYPFTHERHIFIGAPSGPLGLVDKAVLYIFKGL